MSRTNEELEKELVKLTAMLLEVNRRNYYIRQALQTQAVILASVCQELARPLVTRERRDIWIQQHEDVAESVRKASAISD